MEQDGTKGERIAKVMARAGVASRRDAERMILAGRVAVNGATVTSPATDVAPGDKVTLDGKPIDAKQPTRLWVYYKPLGLVTSEKDEKGRQTVFDTLPEGMPRVMSVGRLDLTSEGLLLLTNDGGLKRRLELPETGWLRKYRVRVNGRPNDLTFDPLRRGVVIDGEEFQPMEIALDRQQGANAWLTVGIREGKNREVRRAMAEVGLVVNRLIRVSYGPFRLNQMKPGDVVEVKARVMRDQLGALLEGGEDRPARRAAGGGDRPRFGKAAGGAEPLRKPRSRPEGGGTERTRGGRPAEDGSGRPQYGKAHGDAAERKPRPAGPRGAERPRNGDGDGDGETGRKRHGKPAEGTADRPRYGKPRGEAAEGKPRYSKPRGDGGAERPRSRADDGDTGRKRYGKPAEGASDRPRYGKPRGEAAEGKPRRSGTRDGGAADRPRAPRARTEGDAERPRTFKPRGAEAGGKPRHAKSRGEGDAERPRPSGGPRKPRTGGAGGGKAAGKPAARPAGKGPGAGPRGRPSGGPSGGPKRPR